jgi:hypothetical protein
MRPQTSEYLERCRIKGGPLASDSSYGMNGAFTVMTPIGVQLNVIASNLGGWEHVSVTHAHHGRTPTWDEMCFCKGLFWDDEETVVQYHPPKSRYINNHPFVLHLFKPEGVDFPLPPIWMVGVKA